MTNYNNFPSWRKYGIVMKFNDYQYSWCDNSKANRKYLIESTYCDGGVEFYVWENDTTYNSLDEFKKYLKQKQEQTTPEMCPLCGAKLVLRKNRNDGSSFYGCSKYPECKFTKRA